MTNELMTLPINLSLPELAERFAASGMFPSIPKAAQALVKIIAGRELGIGPFASMTGLHLIQGRPEVGAHLIASALKRSPKYDYRVLAKSATECRIRFLERVNDRWESLGEETWTIDDAKRAGLAGKGTWAAHPAAMLFARCISSGYRTYTPDVFEAAVYVDGEIEQADPVPVQARVVELVPVVATPIPDAADEQPTPIDPPEYDAAVELLSQLEGPAAVQGTELLTRAGKDPAKLIKLQEWAARRLVEAKPVQPTPDSELVGKIREHLAAGRLTQIEVDAVLAGEGAADLAALNPIRQRHLEARGRWAGQKGA